MAGLSSNVMNMKFMQKAENRNPAKTEEAPVRKVRDSSEWALPNKQELKQKIHPQVKVSTMGYGSIASLKSQQTLESSDEEDPESKPESKEPQPLAEEVAETSKKDAEDFLKSIMSKPSKKRKSKQDSGKVSKKKKLKN